MWFQDHCHSFQTTNGTVVKRAFHPPDKKTKPTSLRNASTYFSATRKQTNKQQQPPVFGIYAADTPTPSCTDRNVHFGSPLCTVLRLPWRSLARSSLQSGLRIRQVSTLHGTGCARSWSGRGRRTFVARRGLTGRRLSCGHDNLEGSRLRPPRGFGVSLCILGTMDEMIQPREERRLRVNSAP